ncbi:MAG TPA: BlaI/MecI/CopY family transcriptional regulator [Gemmataceae bacterium]|jgi:BlaI family penicillinase repressor
MAETSLHISDAEWQVMQAIWERRSATAAELIVLLSPQTGWQHRTVRTLLARLVEKGALSAQSEGNRYVYTPLVSRARCIRQESRAFLNKVFGGDAAELLVHFVRDANIPAEEIDKLKRLLDEKRPRQE